jgi:hypothetical protein
MGHQTRVVLAVPTFADAARIATGLPGVTAAERHGNTTWVVGGKAFAWERPFSKADIRRYGETVPPTGSILAAAVIDLDEKDAVLASSSRAVFTIPHFNGYAAVLVQLEVVAQGELKELITDAWLVHAPAALRARHGPG